MMLDATSYSPTCPECGQPMKSGGLVLSRREDGGQRVCRSLWKCAKQHFWWGVGRPDGRAIGVLPSAAGVRLTSNDDINGHERPRISSAAGNQTPPATS